VILPNIILDNRGGFIQKIQIIDNSILVQNAFHSSRIIKEKMMIIKKDMANTFDYVHHFFWFEVLHEFVFA
jgi:hypothetical protein